MTLSLPADPYPWPYDTALEPERLALVVTGTQQWFVSTTINANAAMIAIDGIADAVRRCGGLVVHAEHCWVPTTVPPRTPYAPPRGDPGAAPVLRRDPADVVVECYGLDAFHGSSLELRLRLAGRDQLVVCGLGLESTVSSTLRSANDRGFECLTLTDVSSAHDPSLGEHTLSSITMSGGIFGAIAASSALLDALSSLPSRPPALEVTP